MATKKKKARKPAGKDKADKATPIRTERDAIEAVLAAGKTNSPALTRALIPKLGGSHDRAAAIVEQLDDREAPRFVANLKQMRDLVGRVALPLVRAGLVVAEEQPKLRKRCLVLCELLEVAPAVVMKKDPGHGTWLTAVNDAIYEALEGKRYDLAERLADLGRPHVRTHDWFFHNAACAYAARMRYAEAIEMVRIAVENEYDDLPLLLRDKLIAPLRKMPAYRELFA